VDVLAMSPEEAAEIGNAASLMLTWLDATLEFTILKHEITVLRLQVQKVVTKIKDISKEWPRRKRFIEGAYRILLFTKLSRKQITFSFKMVNDWMPIFSDMRYSQTQVLKQWYTRRLKEEELRNQELRSLKETPKPNEGSEQEALFDEINSLR
jgi:hypothetical protein